MPMSYPMQTAPATPVAAAPQETPRYSLTIPRIGEHWPLHGGIFAGLVAGADGQPDHILILGPEAPTPLKWHAAMDCEALVKEGGHADWRLPTRRELAVLYGNLKSQFKEDWYWSSEQYAGFEGYAWFHTFDFGDQSLNLKNDELRARAVRSVVI